MKRINDLAIKEVNNLRASVKEGKFDSLYPLWATLRTSGNHKFTHKEAWNNLLTQMANDAESLFKNNPDPHRFYTMESANVQVQVFVMGGFNGTPYETSSSIVLTVH